MRVYTSTLPSDDRGPRLTVAAIAALARNALRDPLLAHVAVAIVESAPPGAGPAALRAWLRERWTYRADSYGEELTDPRLTLVAALRGSAAGDCDDVAALAAALGYAAGYSARLILWELRALPGPFSHVFCELAAPGGCWVELDVTRPDGADPSADVTRAEAWSL